METRLKDQGGTMKRAVITVIIIFLLAACDNSVTPGSDSPADSDTYAIVYSASSADVTQLLEREWAKVGTDFTYLFQPDGTVSVIHCCGDVFTDQFNYLFRGNVLVTYGAEMDPKEKVTGFTMAADGSSFTRNNGTSFTRGEARDSPGSALALSNKLIGNWQGEDGTKYVFGPDSGLMINSDQYGYLVRGNELLTLGPLVDGEMAFIQKYKFNRAVDKLSLSCSDGQKYTLTSE
jgi:hypothetical protein